MGAVRAMALLRGTTLAAFAAGVLGCASAGGPAAAPGRTDREMAQQVRDALEQNRYVAAEHVQVEALGGVVRLSGKVANADELIRVLRIADAVPGVRQVDDEVTIEQFGLRGGAH